MRDRFLKFERWTTAVTMLGACAMLVIASSLGLIQIIAHLVLERPAAWAEAMIRFSLIWMVFLGIPAAFRQGTKMSVGILYRWSPPQIKRVVTLFVALTALSLVVVTFWWGWGYANSGKIQSMVGLDGVSMFWTYVAMPFGGIFSATGVIGNLLDPQYLTLERAE